MQHHGDSKGKTMKTNKWESYKMFLYIVPFLVLLFIFSYLPLYGWIYAFFDYTPPLKLSQCPFVGWKWFYNAAKETRITP